MAAMLTLYPAGPADELWAAENLRQVDGARWMVAVSGPLGDGWAPAMEGLVEVRRAACGGDCRCAGEFRVVGSGVRR